MLISNITENNYYDYIYPILSVEFCAYKKNYSQVKKINSMP